MTDTSARSGAGADSGTSNGASFAIFDVETRIDKALLNRVYFSGENLTDGEAYDRYREDLRIRRDSDFLPLTLHLPISIAVGNVDENYALASVESIAEGNYSEETLVREFWRRAELFGGTIVSFNGRRFDLPVLELAALRYGVSAPLHFSEQGKGRDRYSGERHFDLFDFLSNYGAASLAGGLDLLLKMIGMPGKGEMYGARVQEQFEAGALSEIHRYCRRDVVQTYFLFLRVQLMRGIIDERQYRAAADSSTRFLEPGGCTADRNRGQAQ